MSTLLKRGGTVTIKKGSGSDAHGDKPEYKESDILLDRSLELKSITKGFIAYYEDIAKLETHNAEQITRIGGHIALPLKNAEQFLPQGGAGGWQDILYHVRDETRAIADQHTDLAHSISESVVHALQRTKTELKNFISELETEPSRLAKVVAEQRAESTKLISTLTHGIASAKGDAFALSPKEDPVLIHRRVDTQLKKQLNEENALTRSLQTYQVRMRDLESKVVKDIQKATADFSKLYAAARTAITKDWEAIHAKIGTLDDSIEFSEFAKRSDFLIPQDAAMRDAAQVSFPGQHDDLAKPVKTGMLERKKRFTKTYKEGFFVLTPSGFLHEYKTSDPTKQSEPELSIFLPSCVLGPPAQSGGKNKWHVESKTVNKGGGLSKMKRSLKVGKADVAYSFKANSHASMMEWWQAMEGPAKASLAAATTTSNLQDGQAVSAVRGVGYAHDDKETATADSPSAAADEEDEDEEEGGSSDEEEEAVDAPEAAPVASTSTATASETLPEYEKGSTTAATGDVKEKPTISGWPGAGSPSS